MAKNRKSEVRVQDHLLQLIQALSPSEKGYFKKYISARADSKKYEKLFDALAGYKTYDADKLCADLGIKKRTLADDKEYLTDVLMRALRSYHDKDKYLALYAKLIDIRILMTKDLHEPALYQVEKTLQDTKKYAYPQLVLALIANRTELLRRMSNIYEPGFLDAYNKSIAEVRDLLEFISIHLDFEEFSLRIGAHKAQRIFDRTEAEFAASRALLNDNLLTRNFAHPFFRQYQNSNKSLLYYMMGRFEDAADCEKQNLQLNDEFPGETLASCENFVASANNYINHLIYAGKFAEVEEFLKKLDERYYRHMPIEVDRIDTRLEWHMYLFRIKMYHQQLKTIGGDKTEIRNYLALFGEKERRFKKNMPVNLWLACLFRAARTFYILSDYEQALNWLWKLIQESDTESDIYVNCIIRLAYAMIHAEVGHYDLIPSFVQSTRLLFRKHQSNNELQELMLSFLVKLPKLIPGKERNMAFDKLMTDFEKMESDPFLKQEIELFEYRLWIERNRKLSRN